MAVGCRKVESEEWRSFALPSNHHHLQLTNYPVPLSVAQLRDDALLLR
jgi:hypothetical protein